MAVTDSSVSTTGLGGRTGKIGHCSNIVGYKIGTSVIVTIVTVVCYRDNKIVIIMTLVCNRDNIVGYKIGTSIIVIIVTIVN